MPGAPADVWAAGVCCLRGADRGEPVPRPHARELAERHADRPRPLAEVRPDLGRALASASARALSRDPRRRPSAASLATVFEAAADRIEAPASSRVLELRPAPAPVPLAGSPLPACRAPQCACRGCRYRPAAQRSARPRACLLASGLPTPLAERACAIARRVGPGVAAALAVEALLRAFPFWPASLVTPLALACGGLAVAAPWSAAALVLVVCVPGLGNLSSALAWTFALLGCSGSASRPARGGARSCLPWRRRRFWCSPSPRS